MAAGEGLRLRPLTARWAKPVLPIDGRPVVVTLVRELANAGFRETWIVVGHLGDQIEALLGNGSAFGVRVRYARQPEALGSAEAIVQALEAGARAPLLVCAADTAFAPGDLARARSSWLESDASGGLGVRALGPRALRHQTRVRVEHGCVVRLSGEPQVRDGRTMTAAPLWFFDADLAGRLNAVPGPPFEAATVFSDAMAAGKRIAALELGPTRDITRPEDVMERNFAYLLGLATE